MTKHFEPHVVIVGGGFGGLAAAQALAGKPVEITLIDRTNHHLFQPLLYQVAMAGLSPADIAQPIRSVLAPQENCTVLLAEAVSIDLASKTVQLTDGELRYDYLILATGAQTSYFGHAAWERFAPGLKSIDDAIEIRQRVLLAFETAERERDDAKRDALLSFVVIGAGATGVEVAGALAELARTVLKKDFRNIRPEKAKVRLIEGGPRILPAFPEDLAARATDQLVELGVEVRTGTRVNGIDEGGVTLAGGERIPAAVIVWGAGVSATPLTQTLGAALDKMGRVEVEKDLTIPGHKDAFAIGDACVFMQDGQPLPGLGAVAMQMGKTCAKSILLQQRGGPTIPFVYWDKGSMATIGRSRAIAMVAKMRITGFLAWLVWLFVHLILLMGFRNRLVVLFTWFWSYITYRRGARLITSHYGMAATRKALPDAKPSRERERVSEMSA